MGFGRRGGCFWIFSNSTPRRSMAPLARSRDMETNQHASSVTSCPHWVDTACPHWVDTATCRGQPSRQHQLRCNRLCPDAPRCILRRPLHLMNVPTFSRVFEEGCARPQVSVEQLVSVNPDHFGLCWIASDEDWRKGVGVEPTKSRLATLSGFEGQPPHRERFPSNIDLCRGFVALSPTPWSPGRIARALPARCGADRHGAR